MHVGLQACAISEIIPYKILRSHRLSFEFTTPGLQLITNPDENIQSYIGDFTCQYLLFCCRFFFVYHYLLYQVIPLRATFGSSKPLGCPSHTHVYGSI